MNWLVVILIGGLVMLWLPTRRGNRRSQGKRAIQGDRHRHTEAMALKLREVELREEQLALERERFDWQVEQAELAEEIREKREDQLY